MQVWVRLLSRCCAVASLSVISLTREAFVKMYSRRHGVLVVRRNAGAGPAGHRVGSRREADV